MEFKERILVMCVSLAWSKDCAMGEWSAGSLCQRPHTVVTLRRNLPLAA